MPVNYDLADYHTDKKLVNKPFLLFQDKQYNILK